MRILFLTNQLEIGGVEKNLVRLTKELVSRGHEPWTASGGGTLVNDLIEAGGRHVSVDFPGANPLAFLRAISTLSSCVRSFRPDVVHTFSAASALLWKFTALSLRLQGKSRIVVPSVSSVMGLQNSPTERPFLTKLRVFLTSVGARRLIVMAPAIDDVVRSLPISKRRLIHASAVGVDVPHDLSAALAPRKEVRTELGVHPKERVVLTVGNLEPRKSHHLFIKAAQILSAQRDDVYFLIVGEGACRAELEKLLQQGPPGQRITMAGARHDVERLLTACDVYVRPGIVEGFIGITVLEAQALALPVVAFELEDVKLAIEDGETGRLVFPRTADQLALAIGELLDDAEQANRLGVSGRRHVEKIFSMPTIADSLLRIYGDVSLKRY